MQSMQSGEHRGPDELLLLLRRAGTSHSALFVPNLQLRVGSASRCGWRVRMSISAIFRRLATNTDEIPASVLLAIRRSVVLSPEERAALLGRLQELSDSAHKGRELSSEEARAMAAMRTNTGNAGRKRKKGPRCECGENTLRRAKARNFDCCKRNGIEAFQPQTKKPSTKRK